MGSMQKVAIRVTKSLAQRLTAAGLQQQVMLRFTPQCGASFGVIGHQCADRAPERWGMIHLAQVRHFMRCNVIDPRLGALNESPVHADASAGMATAPARSRAG